MSANPTAPASPAPPRQSISRGVSDLEPPASGGPPIPSSSEDDPASRRRAPVPTNAELDAMIRAAAAPTSRNTAQERRDEKCWSSSRQTNARRALGRDPVSSAFCYLNFRHQIGTLVPIPGQPNTFIARDEPSPTPLAPKPVPLNLMDPNGPQIPAYHWKALDGRFFWYGRGREIIYAHGGEMGKDWKGLAAMTERCEKAEKDRTDAAAGPRETRMQAAAVRRALGLDDTEDYETLINLSHAWSSNMQGFHRHVHRIYSPAFKNLARLPETFRDGTQERILGQIYTKLSDGSAYALLERMVKSTVDVAKQLRERRASGGDGGGLGPPGGLPGLGGPGGPSSAT